MELTETQYERIAPYLQMQRGNVRGSNLHVLNVILYVAEHGCKWRGVPARFGRWHTIYTRMNRWSKTGVLDQVFAYLQKEQFVRIKLEVVSLDSPIVKVHSKGRGREKNGPQAIGKSRGMDHQDSSGCRGCTNSGDILAVPWPSHDAPEGRKLLRRLGGQREKLPVLMDRA